MAEQYLHDAGINFLFQKPRRIAVAQCMRCDATGNARFRGSLANRTPQNLTMKGGRTSAVRAKPAGIAMGQPKRPQLIENRGGNRDLALFVALSDDPNQPIDFVDGGDFQRRGLADPQSASVHEQKSHSVNGISDASKEGANFGIGEDGGEPLVLGRTDSFFEKRAHSRSSVR
jgi:hypothetical protein